MSKSNRFKYLKEFLLMILGLLVLSTLLPLIFSGFRWYESFSEYLRRISYSFFIGLSFGIGNWIIGTTLGNYLNWRKNLQRSNLISLISFIVYGIIVSLSLPYVFSKYYWNIGPEKLAGVVMFNAFFALSIDLMVIAVFNSYYLVHYWKKSLVRFEEVKRENLLARYETLKNQVNPHFLFNSLNTLTGVVEKTPGKATEYIKKLSDIYRYVLDQKDKELSRVSDELEFVKDYIFLEKIRHGDALHFTLAIRSQHSWVAPLALQMLIENAVKHNIVSNENPLCISLIEKDDFLIVKNNYQKRKIIEKKQPVGLENLVKRYEFISEKKVIIEQSDTHFVVKLPVILTIQK